MAPIEAGILTPTTKTELEKVEAERARLQEVITANATKADKVVTLLPRAKERLYALVKDLGNIPEQRCAQAREQIRTLFGEIKLMLMAEGYLEAELVGNYAGLLKLAAGAK